MFHAQALAPLAWDLGPVPAAAADDVATALQTHEEPQVDDEVQHAAMAGVYTSGKRLSRLAQLALTAAAVGDRDAAQSFASRVCAGLAPWLETSPKASLLVYDGDAGGVVTRRGRGDEHADFGNGKYNDHHFHYGYLLHAAAVCLRFGGHVEAKSIAAVALDVVNVAGRERWLSDATDDRFYAKRSGFLPLARHKDFYDGHSWASGLFSLADGKSQESVSEALNCYYGAALLGSVQADAELRDFSRLLLALETRAAKHYWHIDDTTTYPEPFASNGIVAVVGASDASKFTWFGGDAAYAHLINALPFTPASIDLLAPAAYVAKAAKLAADGLPDALGVRDPGAPPPPTNAAVPGDPYDALQGPWRGLLSQLVAVVNASAAYDDARALAAAKAPPKLDATQSLPAMLYWAATRRPQKGWISWATWQDPMQPAAPEAPAPETPAPEAAPAGGDASCASRAACASAGLVGDCCPTEAGVVLGCCD